MFFDIENWLWKSNLGTFCQPMWTSVKAKSKKYFSFTDFFAKIKPLTSAKLHHWGHTNHLLDLLDSENRSSYRLNISFYFNLWNFPSCFFDISSSSYLGVEFLDYFSSQIYS